MTRVTFLTRIAVVAVGLTPAAVHAQQPQATPPFSVGNPLGLPVTPGANGAFEPMSAT